MFCGEFVRVHFSVREGVCGWVRACVCECV